MAQRSRYLTKHPKKDSKISKKSIAELSHLAFRIIVPHATYQILDLLGCQNSRGGNAPLAPLIKNIPDMYVYRLVGAIGNSVDPAEFAHSVGVPVLEPGLVTVNSSLGALEAVGAAVVTHHERVVVVREVKTVVVVSVTVTCQSLSYKDVMS